MWLKSISSAALLVSCNACAAPLPEHDPSMAWIDVLSQAGHRLAAQRMDGNKVTDARYFQVSAGEHQLQVRLTYERGGSNTADSLRRCLVEITYPKFAAGQRDSIRALAKGWTVRAWLYNAEGQRLIESKPIRCGSQY